MTFSALLQATWRVRKSKFRLDGSNACTVPVSPTDLAAIRAVMPRWAPTSQTTSPGLIKRSSSETRSGSQLPCQCLPQTGKPRRMPRFGPRTVGIAIAAKMRSEMDRILFTSRLQCSKHWPLFITLQNVLKTAPHRAAHQILTVDNSQAVNRY